MIYYLLCLLAGIFIGVLGITIYQIWGVPTLPSEIKEDGDWLPSGFLKGAKWYNKDGIPTDIHGNWIPDPDSLDGMGITQKVEIKTPHEFYYFDEHGTEVSRDEFMRDLSDSNKQDVKKVERGRIVAGDHIP